MTDGEHIPHEDLALYAMQALESVDASVRLQGHLQRCEACRGELAALQGDLAALAVGMSDPLLVPAGARQRFLARIALEGPERVVEAAPVPAAVRPRRKRIPFLLPWAVCAVALLLAADLGVENHNLRKAIRNNRAEIASLAKQTAHANHVLEMLTAPTAQRVTLTEGHAPAPTGHAIYMPEHGALLFIANNLKPLSAEWTYELWLVPANGHPPMPAGTFRPDDRGTAGVMMPPLPAGVAAKAFCVTIEKAGGSDTPTMPIIISGT